MISIRVLGNPAPQGSKDHVGGGRMIESSKAVAPWRQAVAWSAKEAMGEQKALQTPCSVTITFFLKRPNKPKFRDHPATRPDLDKLVRSTLDGLVFGGAIADDSLVVDLGTCKRWSDDSHLPGATISLVLLK